MKSFVDLNRLPPVVAWLAGGPEPTKRSVLAAKRQMLLRQAPIAFGSIALFSVLRSLGLVEAKGHMQLVAHFCSAAAFMWPVPLFAVCLAAKRDMPGAAPQLKNKLRALSIATGFVSVFSAMTLAGVALVYAYTMLHYL